MINLTDTPVYISNQPGPTQKQVKERNIRSFMGLIGFLIPAVFLSLLLFSNKYYFDIQESCLIKLTSQKTDNTKDLTKEAISILKSEDPGLYVSLCSNISHIRESYCIEAADNNPNIKYLQISGCYIKGTKTIFVTPGFGKDADQILSMRLDALKTYPKFSATFWNVK